MLFISSTPELIRNLWQLKAAVFLHWRLIFALPLVLLAEESEQIIFLKFNSFG
jgi:hypothetical protein